MTLSTAGPHGPYSCACFYVFEFPFLLFASDPGTRHGQEIVANPGVAVAVHDNVRDVAAIKGVQATGICRNLDADPYPPAAVVELRELYLQQFPEARELDPVFWSVRLDFLKYTDNSVRFGYKLVWPKDSR